jgi:hypothetical protein
MIRVALRLVCVAAVILGVTGVAVPLPAVAASSVTNVTLTTSGTVGGEPNVTWTLAFSTSASGGGATTITVAAPAAGFPASASAYSVSGHIVSSPVPGSGTVAITVAPVLPASTQITLAIQGLTNPSSGTNFSAVTVATSADTAPAGVTSPGTFTAPQAVTAVSFHPITTTAGGALSSWDIWFTTSSTGALHAGDRITVSAPSGTVFNTPVAGTSTARDLTQQTTGNGLCCTLGMSLMAPGGSSATFTLFNNSNGTDIPAGHRVALDILQVTNPAATTPFTGISVSTQPDLTPVSVPTSGAFTAPQGVSGLSFTPSTTAGGATSTWVFQYTQSSTGRLEPRNSTITVTAPAGTTLPTIPSGGAACPSTAPVQIHDMTTNFAGTCDSGLSSSATGMSFTTPLLNDGHPGGANPYYIKAGDVVLLTIAGVVNPPNTTAFSGIGLSTGSDPTVVNPSSGAFTAAGQSVSAASLVPTSAAAGATHVSWTVGFTTTGDLSAPLNNVATSSVMLALPAGTVPPSLSCSSSNYFIEDATDRTSGSSCQSVSFSAGTLTLGMSFHVPSGHRVLLSLTDMTNPSAPGSFSGVTVATTADTAAVGAGGGSFAAQQPVSGLTVTATSAAGSAANTGWVADFTTSPAGGLAAGISKIVLTAPAGSVLPANGQYSLVDATTGVAAPGFDSQRNTTSAPAVAVAGQVATMTMPFDVAGGDELRLFVHSVTNPAPGTGSGGIHVATTSDSAAAGGPAFVAGVAPTAVTLVPSNSTGAATGVSWSVGFTSTSALDPGDGTITVAGPAATAFTNGATATILDLRTGQRGTTTVSASGTSGTVTVPGNVNVRAGDSVLAVLTGITNPAALTAFTSVHVSTSGDPVTAAPASGMFDGTTAANQLANPTFATSTTAGGATNVVWTMGFTIGTNGALTASTDSLLFSSTTGGTVLPANGGAEQCPYAVYDLTSGVGNGCVGGTVSTGTATIPMPLSAAVGDQLLLVAFGVTNPAATTNMNTIGLTTTKLLANTINPASATFATAQAPTAATFAPSTAAGGATAASWVIGFTASSTGGLAASASNEPLGGIEIKLPNGALPLGGGNDYIVTNVTSGAATNSEFMFTGGSGTDRRIGAFMATESGDRIVLRSAIDGVTNPTAATPFANITLQTSSDPTALAMPAGSFATAGSPGSAALLMSSTAGGATGTLWTFVFTTSATGGLVPISGGALSATLPSGAAVIGGTCVLVDVTTGASTGNRSCSGTPLTLPLPANFTVGAGDQLRWYLLDVTNPATSTSLSAPLSTTSDTAVTPTPPTSTATAPAAITGLSLAPATLSGGASSTPWTITFTASASGDIEPDNGEILITAPAGTSFDNTVSSGCAYGRIRDLTAGWDTSCPSITEPSGSNTIAIPVTTFWSTGAKLPIRGGDVVQVELRRVTNPPGAASFSGVSVHTTSDTVAASPSGAFTAPTGVSGVTLSASPNNGGSGGSTWTFDFTATSAVSRFEGYLHVDTGGGNWPFQNCFVVIADLTQQWWQRTCLITPSTGGPTLAAAPQFGDAGINAGDQVEVVLFSVTNPSAGTPFSAVKLTTDTDTVMASPSGSFGPQAQLSGRILDGQGHNVSSAVQACHNGNCLLSPANLAGVYDFAGPLTQGTWSLTAFPEQNQNVTLTSVSVVVGAGTITRDIALQTAAGLPAGVHVNGGSGQARVFWHSPTQMSFDPASVNCPSPGTFVGSAFRVTGVDVQTGVLSNQDFPIGGTLQGVPIGVAGNPTVNGIIPPLAPVHGSVSVSLVGTCYPGGTPPPPAGVAHSSTVFFFDDSIGEHQKAVLANGSPSALTMGAAGAISGVNGGDFFVEPTTPPGSVTECGTAAIAVPQQMSCSAQVRWTPDANPNDVEEFASLRVPVGTSYVDVDLHGCSRIKAARFGRTCGQPTGVPEPQGISMACPTSDGHVGSSYNDAVVASGGATPFTYSLLNGTLPPPGLTLNGSTGAITGMPSTPGSTLFTVQATANDGATQGVNCVIAVDQNKPTLSCPAGFAQSGQPYASGMTASGGTPGYTFSIIGGGLPGGLGLNGATGAITGSPGAEGVYFFTAQVVDSTGTPAGTNTATCSIQVVVPVYVDPSGVVTGQTGGGSPVPLQNASVTLLQSGSVNGPFSPVANGSAIMSPSNQANPSTTDSQGRYGWDVVAGFYQIQAHVAGCTDATSPVLTVPPPAVNIDLALTNCSSLPAQAASGTALAAGPGSPAAPGTPVTLTATVTPASVPTPTGVVTFTDGATNLGSGPVFQDLNPPHNFIATLSTAALASGAHSVTATYGGDASHAGSASTPLAYTITGTPPPPPATAVTAVTASPSPPAAGVASTYTVTFATSSAGALTPGTDTITLAAPAGTVFSSNPADYAVNSSAVTAVVGGGTSTAILTVPAAATGVGALAAITVIAGNTVNPGANSYTLSVNTSKDTVPVASPVYLIVLPPGTARGYWLVASDGGIFRFGNLGFYRSLGGIRLNRPVVGMAPTPTGNGYWLVASDGGVFAFGDAHFWGSTGGKVLNRPVVGMAATPTGLGYWLVASDGGVFAFGDAQFWGSMGGRVLNRPVVGMAATPSGNGYWLVADDGGIFNFGDAGFFGSTGALKLNRPVVGMAALPSGGGYWLVASDGGIFAFHAPFLGSMGATRLNQPVVGMAAAPSGTGYWLVAADGGTFTFSVPFLGSTGALTLNKPVVGMAAA